MTEDVDSSWVPDLESLARRETDVVVDVGDTLGGLHEQTDIAELESGGVVVIVVVVVVVMMMMVDGGVAELVVSHGFELDEIEVVVWFGGAPKNCVQSVNSRTT